MGKAVLKIQIEIMAVNKFLNSTTVYQRIKEDVEILVCWQWCTIDVYGIQRPVTPYTDFLETRRSWQSRKLCQIWMMRSVVPMQ